MERVCFTAVVEKSSEAKKRKMHFFEELDKGIDDMEADWVIGHEETMRIFKERVKQYEL